MTKPDKISLVKVLVENDPEATDEVVSAYLSMAINAMIERLFPFDSNKSESDVPVRYDATQCELAARYFLRKGGQGELSHEENGVNRSYATVDDEDILKRLTPFVKVGG